MKIKRKDFGILASGETVRLYVLKAGGLTACFSTLGATLVSLSVPSKSGRVDDVVLGFSTLGPYAGFHPYFGATVGRYANRIAGARFVLDGETRDLGRNDGPNCLHGGVRGFDRRVWKAEAYAEKGGAYVRMTLDSPDGDEGFPGNLRAEVTYGLDGNGALVADYRASVDRDCPVSLTNHAYFNLRGEGRGDVLGHELQLAASSYVEADEALIPTGVLVDVEGGAFDFRVPKAIGRDIAAVGHGYDHCYAIDGEAGKLRPCAVAREPESGRVLRLSTTQPGVQLYTGNFLDGVRGKMGAAYGKHAGFCLETQHFPDAPNRASFPSCVYGPGRKYREKAVFAFEW